MTGSSRSQWDLYWQHIEPEEYVNYTPRLLDTISQHVQLDGSRVLEIGAGTGGNSCRLAEQGAIVVAIDFSLPALMRMQSTAAKSAVRLEIAAADAFHLPFGRDTFDLILHQGFLEHFIDPTHLLREQYRVLRPGGCILVDVPQRYNWYTPYKHRLIRANRWPYGGWEREFSLAELTGLLESVGFQVIDRYGRGYFPRVFLIARELHKIETRVTKHRIVPPEWWSMYDDGWDMLERSWLGCNMLQCVGVFAVKQPLLPQE